MVTLTIHPPGSTPVTHVLKDETITIGRMAGNTIVVNDSSVSLMHAKITKKDGQFFVKDLNSTNGTRVNGQPVTEARLRDRDAVRFADVNGQFNQEVPETKPVAAAIISPIPQSQPPPPSQIVSAPAAPRPPAPNPRRLVPTLAAATGGIAVLGVVSFLVWNLARERMRGSSSASAPAANPRAPLASIPSPAASGAPASPTNSPVTPAAEQPPPTVPQLIKTLQDPDPAERRQAVAALHSLGPDAASATPALHQALSDPDQEVRLWAALALINIKSYDKAIPPILIHVLHDEKPMVRQLACVSLGLLPYEPAEKDAVVPALVAAANTDTDEDVRKAAIAALDVIDADASMKTLTK